MAHYNIVLLTYLLTWRAYYLHRVLSIRAKLGHVATFYSLRTDVNNSETAKAEGF